MSLGFRYNKYENTGARVGRGGVQSSLKSTGHWMCHRGASELGTRSLGKNAYEQCLAHEMHLAGLSFRIQVPLPVVYKGVTLDCGYRIDDFLVIELKAVDAISDFSALSASSCVNC